MTAIGERARCEVCAGARVTIPASYEPRRDVLCWGATVSRLLARLAEGEMTYLRYDVPIEDIMLVVEADFARTVNAYMRCEQCGREWLLVAGPRSPAEYREVPAGAYREHEWEPVPDESLWRDGPSWRR